MKALITSRDGWTNDLQKQFGELSGVVHTIPDTTAGFLELMAPLPRLIVLRIDTPEAAWQIEFQPDYD